MTNTPEEKITHIILVQARIENLLTKILVEYIPSITKESLDNLDLGYKQKLDFIKYLSNSSKWEDLYGHLLKMGDLRNKVAHNDLLLYITYKEHKEGLSYAADLEKRIGKTKKSKNLDIDHIYGKYLKHELEIKDFFGLDSVSQKEMLNGV